MKRIFCLALALATLTVAQAGWFGPQGDNDTEKKAGVRKQRDEMLHQLYATNPEMKRRLKQAAGYATFKQTDMNLFLLASGNGYGVLRDNHTQKDIFMRVASLGGGVGLGVKDMRLIFVFNDAKVMHQFVEEGWQFGGKADVSAKYKDAGLSAEQNVKGSMDFHDGTVVAAGSTDVRTGSDKNDATGAAGATRGAMEIYQFTDSGVSLQATVSGAKFWKDSALNK